MSRFLFVVRILLGVAFIVSGYSKLLAPFQNFLAVIHGYELVYGWPATVMAKFMPWLELIFGVFLILGLWSRVSVIILWLMNAAFIFALLQALIRRLPIGDCGCFGDSFHLKPLHMLLLDAVFFVLFLMLYLRRREAFSRSFDSYFESARSPRGSKKGR